MTTVDTIRIPPAGDPFTAKQHEPTAQKLAKLEKRLAHELMDDEEHQELRDRVLRLRRHLSR
jgi:hypothetical protein